VIDLSRYVFETLRNDEEFVLYRGQHRDVTSRILVLSPARQRPSPEDLKRLENEYSLKEELDPTWAARPVAITIHWDRTVLVLEDPGGMPLHQLLDSSRDASFELNGSKQPLDLVPALRLAISFSAAIGALHKRGIIHKDVQPANILVNAATGQCWLTGFGIASRLPRERQPPAPPEFIAGTLPYMAPEQTGRMNRSIDSRSDLYALGITLYEILTGRLPFTASDPLEWVHCQVARQAVPPDERSKAVPASVSAIVMKLLAKTAEERYQTAASVERDLRRCLAEWETRRSIVEFPLGEHDWPDQLRIPEKLYGRAREIDTLLASFENVVASGRPELVLVSGYSGIGKSSVVNELHKVLVPPRGLFASGKFDQYKRDIPYSTLAQAFQSLVRPLLAQREAELRVWRDALRDALGPNGLLMVNLVPELKLVIGEQPAVPELPPQDAKARFQLVFQRFVGVFARSEHPLALFLDDLQWLDAATLDFLQDLLTQPDLHHLLLIGAYRDNEVDSHHPLSRKLDAIRLTGARVHEIVLAPLPSEDLGRLLVDSLHCEPERAAPLARLVHEKTAGSPFFAVQFVSALVQEELLTFDPGDGRWSWDLSRIQAKGYTDNVVDLMVGKLNRLPAETQQTLKEFACLGNSAEIATLSVVHGTSEAEVRSALWEALRLELIVVVEGSYKFLHDRIHEAAYSMIPEEFRSEAHLRIGRLLMACTAPERREEAIFEIVNQLNRGAALISLPAERAQLAKFNMIAGKRAKESTAYTSALNYLAAGAAMLPNDSWQRHYQLTFELELHRAECEFLTGRSSAAEERLTMLSSRAATAVELATVTCLHIDLYTTLDQSDRAVAICLEYLRHLGIEWSPHPIEEEAQREYERIWQKIGSRAIEDLIDLPVMSDLTSLGTLDVLTKVLPAALFTDANLMSLFVCRMVNLTLEHGISDGSSFAYVCLAMIAALNFGNYKDAFRFGRLGYELVEKRGLKRFRARTYMVFGSHVMPWTKGLRDGRELVRRAFEVANQIGDLCFAAYSCVNLNTNLLATGSLLVEVEREAEIGLDFARKVRFAAVIEHIESQLGLIRTLRGSTQAFGSFDDGHFDELRFERHLAEATAAQPGCFYWILKLQARFFAGDYASALEASLKARRLLWTAASSFETAEYHFYSALARAAVSHSAMCSFAEASAREEHLRALVEHHKQLALWADNCPMNFENRVALVGAEIARIQNHELDAERFYEQAIRSSHVNGFIHNEALASELAGRFYAARGFDLTAQGYLRKARAGYLAWGAIGKVRQLDKLYPQLREAEHIATFTDTIAAPVDQLDLATVIKASQTLSSEIVFDKLIDTLMRTAIEQAGAQRGLLILPRGVEQRIEAEATTNGDTIIVHLQEAAIAGAAVPESIIHYVVRTQESVILDDASVQNPFSADTYIRRHPSRSILCLPLINQTKLIGLLYLENNLAPHVFTPKRMAVLKLLASQAAISLENTRLYRDLEEREAKIRRLVDANIMGIYIWNLEGEIIEANEAFLHMVEYNREDFVSGRVRWPDLTPEEWRDSDERAIAEIKTTGSLQPFQKEYFRKDGSRLPVMVGGAMFGESKNEGVAFVLDLSQQKHAEDERKRAEDALQEAQTKLEHVTRVAALGELTASIAHEINQPLGAVVNNASACLRWLTANNLEEARQSASLVIAEGHRAGEIISRIRALAKKAPPQKDWLDINETIVEVLAMVRNAAQRNRVSSQTQLANDLPLILGDRIQLQQVILNLLINAIEAMSEVSENPRKFWVSSQRFTKMLSLRPPVLNSGESEEDELVARDLAEAGGTHVLIAVRDSGPGLDRKVLHRLFDAFYTTKPQGLGMGLAISRSIIEAHGGRLWAKANAPRGAVFQFTLPLGEERVS
jgi:PAS domain S-box-containing protein